MENQVKKLNLNKYAFLNYLKGDVFAWLTCDDNYYFAAEKEISLKKANPWRWNNDGTVNKNVNQLELPGPMVAGITASEWSREWAKVKYPNHKQIEVREFSNDDTFEKTKFWLKSDEDLVIFEARFAYGDFNIKTDILIKTGNKIEILELKAVTSPKRLHAYDLLFQKILINNAIPESNNWKFNLLVIDSEYIEYKKYTTSEKAERLFIKSPIFLNIDSKPTEKNGIKWTLRQQLLSLGLEKGSEIDGFEPYKNFTYLTDFFNEDAEVKKIEREFDDILLNIKRVQELDWPEQFHIEERNFKFMDSDYMDFFYKIAGVPEHGSVFEFKGRGALISSKKKLALYDDGYVMMKDVLNTDVTPKDISSQLNVTSRTDDIIDKLIEWAGDELKGYGPIIQKHYLDSEKNFINVDGVRFELEKYKSAPIYMYDFETADLSVPLVEYTRPYQQVPYQFSVHVITNPDDYDFETLHNVEHYEWLAKDKDTFVQEFWDEFIKVFEKHGEGVYVSWNMSFEKTRIKEGFELAELSNEQVQWMYKILDETVDLEEMFKKKYYYADELKGSSSIKYVGPHLVEGKIDYKTLNNVQRGDQSAAKAKEWLITGDQDKWDALRIDMLKYCEFDTLLMVAILQRIQEKVKSIKEDYNNGNIDKIKDKYDISLERLRKWK